jgi:phenylacetate-CoA ligase
MNRLFTRKVLYPAYRALRRDRVLAYLGEMHQVQCQSPDSITVFQARKLQALLAYAGRHVPYYRRLFKQLGAEPGDFRTPADLARLPILRKKDILQNLDDMLSEIYPKGRLAPDSTSGSTGVNLNFYVDAEASQARSANNIRMNEWLGIKNGDKVAFLWGTAFDLACSRRLANSLRNLMTNTMLLSHYTMGETSLDLYTKRLIRFKPDLIVAYPSGLNHFADYLLNQGETRIRPKAVVVSGEAMFQWQKDSIEAALGAPVYNHYGCREFGAMARECRLRNGLHIACERVVLEIVSGRGLPTDGAEGEIVVTDLDNFGMPMIRYAIEDLGSVTWETCGCGLGLPRLQMAGGRVFDVVRAPNGNFLGGSFWTLLMRKVKGVGSFQVIQDKLDQLRIAIVPTAEFSEVSKMYLHERIIEACGPRMNVQFEMRQSIEPTRGGKHRFVVSHLKPTVE